jgi:hypothetical protein
MSSGDTQTKLQEFFSRPVAIKGTSPLSPDAEVLLVVNGQPYTLARKGKKPALMEGAPAKPDLTFEIPTKALEGLVDITTEEVGEIGIAIASHLIHPNPELRMTVKVHIGFFPLIRKGYLSVLPLGGASFMKYLAAKGLTSMSKIRETISKMKD